MNILEYMDDFVDDLLNLYCKTGNKNIENEFLHLSSLIRSGSKFRDDFYQWIEANNSLRKSIQDPEVFDALLFLILIRKKYPSEVTVSDMAKSFVSGKDVRHIPYIMAFGSLLNHPSVGDILVPFQDIITIISSWKMKGQGVDVSSVYNNLMSILDLFNKGDGKKGLPSLTYVQTTKQKKENMFLYLLQRFSEELAIAAEQSDLPDLASAFKENVLAKTLPYGLGQYLDFKQISNQQFVLAKNMAKNVLKNYESSFQNYNHDLVDAAFLHSAGILSKQDIIDLRKSFEEQKDIQKIMLSKGDYPGMNLENKVSIDQRLNPDYLALLSLFFTFMQRKLSVPDVSFTH